MKKTLHLNSNSTVTNYELLDNPLNNQNELLNEDKIELSIKYICYINEPSLILIDKRALNAIKYLKDRSKIRHELEIFFKYETIFRIFVNIFDYYKNELKSFLKITNEECDINDLKSTHSLYISQFNFFSKLSTICTCISDRFKQFCYQFHALNGTKALLDYIDDDEIIDKLLKLKIKNKKKIITGKEVLQGICSTLYNLSTIAENCRKSFQEIEACKTITKGLMKFESNDLLKMPLYLALANIVDDHEIQTLQDIQMTIMNLMKLLKKAAECLCGKTNLTRRAVDIEDNDEIMHVEVCSLSSGWHLYEIFNSLYRLAINDKIKYQIYQEAKESLELIVRHGNITEKSGGLKLLWQLCFDVRVAKMVQQTPQFYEHIQNIVNNETDKDLKKHSMGILWSIKNLEKNTEDHISDTFHEMRFKSRRISYDDDYDDEELHIMISYNSENRAICLKIKEVLEKNKFKVWIDVESIHGSSLEAMAEAVEKSKCVIVCMSEKYKQSPNCRAVSLKIDVCIVDVVEYKS